MTSSLRLVFDHIKKVVHLVINRLIREFGKKLHEVALTIKKPSSGIGRASSLIS